MSEGSGDEGSHVAIDLKGDGISALRRASTVQYRKEVTIYHSTVQYSTVRRLLYITVQYSTAGRPLYTTSTVQYSTVQ